MEATVDGFQSGAIGKRRPHGEVAWITLRDGQTFSAAVDGRRMGDWPRAGSQIFGLMGAGDFTIVAFLT